MAPLFSEISVLREKLSGIEIHQDRVNALAYISDKNMLVSCSHDATIRT